MADGDEAAAAAAAASSGFAPEVRDVAEDAMVKILSAELHSAGLETRSRIAAVASAQEALLAKLDAVDKGT